MTMRTTGAAIALPVMMLWGGAALAQTDATTVQVGGGGEGGAWHSPREWYKPTDAHFGPQHVLLTMLALAGVQDVSLPLLAVRPAR